MPTIKTPCYLGSMQICEAATPPPPPPKFLMEVESSIEPDILSDGTIDIKNNNGVWTVSSAKDVTRVSFGLNDKVFGITKITLKKTATLTSMKSMFSPSGNFYLKNMTEFIFDPTIDTSNVTNMNNLFGGCTALTSISGAEYIKTDNVTDLSLMFSDCKSLQTAPKTSSWRTPKNTNLFRMFASCEKMASAPYTSGWDTSQVTRLDSLFLWCKLMPTAPDTSGWNTSKVARSGRMFDSCEKMATTPDTSSWDTSLITDFSKMFNGCKLMPTAPDTSNWITSKAVNMSAMFADCSLIPSVDLSKADYSSVKNFGLNSMNAGMFMNCSELVSINSDFSSGKSTEKYASFRDMFSGCSKLECFGGIDTSHATDISAKTDMFKNCSALIQPDATAQADITDTNGANWVSLNPCPAPAQTFLMEVESPVEPKYTAQGGSVTVTNVGSGVYEVTSTDAITQIQPTTDKLMINSNITKITVKKMDTITSMESMFYPDYDGVTVPKLKEVIFENVSLDNVTSFEQTFFANDSLTKITMPMPSGSRITTMASMFEECFLLDRSGLPDLSALDVSNVTNMSRMFSNCSALTEVPDLSSWNTGKVTTMSSMFINTALTTQPKFENWDLRKITNIERFITQCTEITHLNLPDMTVIEAPLVEMGHMIAENTKLVCINRIDTSKAMNTADFFYDCNALVAPNTADQAAIINGANWVNPGTCP